MSERRPFKEVKLQWLELLSCDAGVNDSAKCVALYIITRHMNGHTEEAWPSFSTIAEATGKSVKTVQRAIHDLELGGWLDVVRGNGSRRSTRYRPSKVSILQACELRGKTDKVVTLHPSLAGQTCPKRQSKLSIEGGQICPPNQEKEKYIKPNAREGASSASETRPVMPCIFVGKHERNKLDRWRTWFHERGLPQPEALRLDARRNGVEGFSFPSYYPETTVTDPNQIATWLTYYRDREMQIARANIQVRRLAS
ncbi:helix-turn-helix domain-containing protein [Phyllobacterium sp. 0TCS1.6C]|uniref:helix-turn-helix domain-containing protein n=1 Tax=unclassified Phyllobacterium TaxID=2638441 RepID=UPI002264753F|nr:MULTISPECIES: helix-turn-helix domain-containing protein [unclassified Phyllobacterium]MCX8281780.1 helix-turn-helix domain-containing protein [Phyllobacterium sp. 0TCS1.6C]MCX8295315.1 helix-turn-helix domain-containing protein [Phyllobacterium sp. 0TCS1.6A]